MNDYPTYDDSVRIATFSCVNTETGKRLGRQPWRVGLRVRAVSEEEAATIVASSAYFRPVTR